MNRPYVNYADKTVSLYPLQLYFLKRFHWNKLDHWNGKFYWKWYEMINPFCTYQTIRQAQKNNIVPAVRKPTITYPADKYIKIQNKETKKPLNKILKFKGR